MCSFYSMPEEQRRKMQAELEDMLEAALDEGEPVEADDKFWNEVRERFLKNVQASWHGRPRWQVGITWERLR